MMGVSPLSLGSSSIEPPSLDIGQLIFIRLAMEWESVLLLLRPRIDELLLPTTRMASPLQMAVLPIFEDLSSLSTGKQGVERYSIEMIKKEVFGIILRVVLGLGMGN
jgi:hypothetical protein